MNFLKAIWAKWLPIARVIGNFQAQVILTLFYLVVLFPVGVVYRLFADPLRLRSGQALRLRTRVRSNFQKWEHEKQSLEEARKQY